MIAPPVTRPAAPPATARAAVRGTGLGLAAWAVLIAVAHVWGRGLPAAHLRTPPLFATFEPRLNARLLPALALAVAAAIWAPRIAAGAPWRRLLVWTLGAGIAWAVALALLDGPSALTAPLRGPHDYLASLPLAGSPGHFLAGFTKEIGRYSTHVQGHPPGMLLLASALRSVGLGSPALLAGVVVVAGASAAPAALAAAREVCGEPAARRAAPFLPFAPAAVWMATSADALFAGVGAWAMALVVLASRTSGASRTNRRRAATTLDALDIRDIRAFGGGLLFGAALFLSYGLVLLGLVPLAVALFRRRLRPLVIAAAGAAVVVAAFALAGFWWPSGLAATRLQYRSGVGGVRPYGYFLVANLAAFGVALGPACAAGLARLRERGPWLLAGAGSLAVLAADVSGLSKGEVERIWLPFVPWLLLATSALAGQPGNPRGTTRRWLILQLAAGLLVQILFVAPW